MRSERASYEVLCPRCDVTFPIGTRRCVHCGGGTVASTEASDLSIQADPVFDFEVRDDRSRTEPRATDQPKVRSREGAAPTPSVESRSGSLEELDSDSESPSVGRSILGSMGSLIWIALLIAFSLSGRVCGE